MITGCQPCHSKQCHMCFYTRSTAIALPVIYTITLFLLPKTHVATRATAFTPFLCLTFIHFTSVSPIFSPLTLFLSSTHTHARTHIRFDHAEFFQIIIWWRNMKNVGKKDLRKLFERSLCRFSILTMRRPSFSEDTHCESICVVQVER